MTMNPSLSGLTAADYLGPAGSPQALNDALSATGALEDGRVHLGGLLGPLWQSVRDQVSAGVSSVLDVDLGLVCLDAWGVAQEVREARRRTLPYGHEVVDLPQTSISLERTPVVEVAYAGGPPLLRLPLQLSVGLEAPELAVTVVDGRLYAVHTGDCQLTVVLSWANQALARRRGVIVASRVLAKDALGPPRQGSPARAGAATS